MIILYDINPMISIATKIDPELSQEDLIEIFSYCITKDNLILIANPVFPDNANRKLAEVVRRLWRFDPIYNLLEIKEVKLAAYGRLALYVDNDEFYDRNPDAIPWSKTWKEYSGSTTRQLYKGY